MARTKASQRIGHPPLDTAFAQHVHTRTALIHLRAARAYLKAANHPNTLARVRKAIASCEGAVRISEYRVGRAERAREG